MFEQKNQKLIVSIVLILATLAVYWQVNHHGFINLDDNVYVRQNIQIRAGFTIEALHWAFSTTYAEFWHPLTWLSFIFDYKIYGSNAGGYHLTNLILHVMSTLLLFWLFNRMTGAIWKSAFVAALFALHPIHVESVAWIAERKDVLSAFFWMLTLYLYVYYTEKPIIPRYLLVLFSFLLALMSKPMVVTLPLIMILLDYWPLERFKSQKTNSILWQLKEKTPFFVLSLVFSAITFYAQFNPYGNNFPAGFRIMNAFISFMTYPVKILWPYVLTISYPLTTQISLWQFLGAILLIIFISVAVIAMAIRLPYLLVGWLWYAITILPVTGIFKQIGDFAMADRYSYLPSIGISIIIAWGIPLLFTCEDMRKKILLPAGIAVIAILSVLTWQQCGYWKNSIELFNHALQVTKDNSLAHNDLGHALYEKHKIKEAIVHYNEAIRIVPRYPFAYNNRGVAYAKLGQYQNALENFNKAIHWKPDYASAYNNRAMVYFYMRNNELCCSDAQKACALGTCITLKHVRDKGYCR